jgi:hypothetical protein
MTTETPMRMLEHALVSRWSAAGCGSSLAAIPPAAWAHHDRPGENLWHDIEYLLSSPGIVLLIAAGLVGIWIVVKRVRAGNKA